mmetsp:Transcript_2574/g.4005  ORF Transcript_2574/g.4005 Transcript_2574/m.4005 type:complete len:116 (+) Transcript_2574:21-368(+)
MEKNSTEPQEAVDYRRTGAGGTAEGTLTSRHHAKKVLKEFLKTKLILEDLDQIPMEKICDIDLWQQFGTYLCDYAVTNKGIQIKYGTAKTILAQAKTYFERQPPYNQLTSFGRCN